MAAVAGIAAFVVALFISYQIFPDPRTGDMGYAGGRFIFTIAVTIVVSVVASKASARRREEEQQREAEQERQLAQVEREQSRRRKQQEVEHQGQRQTAALNEARERVVHLRSVLQRREGQQRDSGHRLGRFAFGVVADEILAEIVWKQLQIRPEQRSSITADHMASLTGDLFISTYRNHKGFLDLEGIQYATNLTGLALSPMGDRVDLTPLAGLANLRRLEIQEGPGITDIDALATLDGLHELSLARLTSVTDFRPLAGLERLTDLTLSGMSEALEFDSISAIPGLARLEVRNMASLRDLSGIARLSRLREIVLHSIQELGELAPLQQLSHLEVLRIEHARVAGSRQFEGLARLTSVVLREVSGIGDFSGIATPSATPRARAHCSSPRPGSVGAWQSRLGPCGGHVSAAEADAVAKWAHDVQELERAV